MNCFNCNNHLDFVTLTLNAFVAQLSVVAVALSPLIVWKTARIKSWATAKSNNVKLLRLCLISVKRRFRVTSDSRGFTLLEVMIALGILLIGAIGTLNLFTYGLKAADKSKHVTMATNIAREKLEEIKNTPFFDIMDDYPETPEGSEGSDVENESLPDGKWKVSYPNASEGIQPDPLEVSLVVSWQEGDVRAEIELRTLVTSP